MEPLISLTIRNRKPWFVPGESLDCEFQIDRIGPQAIQAVEASVLWSTSGKGDVDMGVHYFERRVPEDLSDSDLRELHRFQTVLPAGPLSYEGELVKIRWCVRIRVFPIKGKETSFDLPFQLGQVPAPSSIVPPAPTKASNSSAAPAKSSADGASKPSGFSGEETESVEMTVRLPDDSPHDDPMSAES